MSRKLIALCGAPLAGKSTVQNILRDEWGVLPVDDGEPLRDFAIRHLGITRHQAYTPEGKNEYVVVGGRRMQVRAVLGQVGNALEASFGQNVVAEMALMKCDSHRTYSFGSVRRGQGVIYRRAGGIVVEVKKPGCEIENEFDRYDGDLIDFTILNDGDVNLLRGRVMHALSPYLAKP